MSSTRINSRINAECYGIYLEYFWVYPFKMSKKVDLFDPLGQCLGLLSRKKHLAKSSPDMLIRWRRLLANILKSPQPVHQTLDAKLLKKGVCVK